MGGANIFQQIMDGTIPCDKVFEDDRVFAFHDINPVAPIHILIIPKKHIPMIENIEETDESLVGHLIVTASKIAKDLELNGSGYRLVFNNGKDAGQVVFHLHLHLLAGRHFTWPPG